MDKEKRAAADAAKQKAADARKAADAKPDDAALKSAAEAAEADATKLEAEASAPSHEPKPGDISKKDKIKRRIEILRDQYVAEGGDAQEFDPGESAAAGDDEDDNKPVTRKDLANMGIVKSAEQLAGELTDNDLRTAVLDELTYIAKSVPAQQRYEKALGLASSSKNARIASEAQRVAGRSVQQHRSGGAAAAADEGDFAPTPQEQVYMTKFKLTKEDIVAARKRAQAYDFGAAQK